MCRSNGFPFDLNRSLNVIINSAYRIIPPKHSREKPVFAQSFGYILVLFLITYVLPCCCRIE